MIKESISILFILFWLFLIVLAFVYPIYHLAYALVSGQENIHIVEKWVKPKGDTAKYLVSSTDGQVFEITDSWILWRWDSSNLYAELKPDMVCTIKTQGWRFPFMSDYKNILEADCR